MMFTEKPEHKCKTFEPLNVCLNDGTTTTPIPEGSEENSQMKMDYEDDNEPDKKSQSQRNDNPTTGAMSNDGKPTRRNNIPLLTGSVQVGLLYDAKSDQPLYGEYLWPPPFRSRDSKTHKMPVGATEIIEADVAHSSMDYIFDENILDRLNLIDVTAELELSFMGGLIEVIIFFDLTSVAFPMWLPQSFWEKQ